MDRRYIGAGLFVVTAVILCIVLVYPKYQQASAASKIAAEKENEFKTQSELITAVNKAYERYKKIDKELSIMQDLLPVPDDQSVAKLFIEFEDLSSQSGLSIQSLSFGGGAPVAEKDAGKSEKNEKGYNSINASISAAGRYEDVKKFADAVRFNKHLMDIVSVNVAEGSAAVESAPAALPSPSGGTADENTDIFSFEFSINAYYQ
ncbi:hypothetical protein A3C91_01635 [Candidatus Azambacteria bacterium RIFCSPHIGHO2_02_FULL_52_12]|uniref:Uncharacterized protein n=1 Tax=Candidatus Azambacteria bacterium RIFCSPLOWO2_01_FULL_46_25 TaxID=1797298 RepID=A0A1F5BVE8_9BACT|nr:MAG: hypothetical protein A3C91_01635 [Candidatus Azambacteria bacterium RIFCSPHIGHO2_02_FULL_52_12]OGD34548.1 MAG: hypothetical protein A2988_03500 [Candidatus Azambacteria bacterium RIFCSPLOWO2_01_FULL_46_25]OGD36422.1 MAG: hypothetical protein A2850_02000 [Candidatus Azambacteria bacterium RIFCSPHIGHO2_01_FULL_51_74]